MVRVVIVGAGLAGLAAANTLCTEGAGLFNVTVLEADSQVGGRVKTAEFSDGSRIPLGATYFHGTEGNSLYQLYTKENGIPQDKQLSVEGDRETLYLLSDGTEIPVEIANEIEEHLDCLLDDKTISSSPLSSLSVYDYLSATLLPKIEASCAKEKGLDSWSLFHGFVAAEDISEGSKYVRDISADTYIQWKWLEGGKAVLVHGNPFQSVVDTIAASLPKGVVCLNSSVESITWSQTDNSRQSVLVTCRDGTTVEADHVVLTVSLGVLKRMTQCGTFRPSLPPERVNVITSLGFGLVSKIIMQFDGPLFDLKYSGLQLHWTRQDIQSDVARAYPWVCGLHHVEYYPTCSANCHFYIAWLCDEDAFAMECLPKETLQQVMCAVLEKCLKQSIPTLLDLRATSWSSDYTNGSYSYTPMGCPFLLREQLGLPLDGTSHLQLLFAGEATCCSQYSCAHPAYDTGIREGQRLLKHYNQL